MYKKYIYLIEKKCLLSAAALLLIQDTAAAFTGRKPQQVESRSAVHSTMMAPCYDMLLPCAVLFLALRLCTVVQAARKEVTLSNVDLPKDTVGNLLLTGEASVLNMNEKYYFYFNDWGSCPGVNCCDTPSGCASCCFKGTNGSCVYTDNHNIVVYETTDFENWKFGGIALNVSNREPGIMFRPHVVYNKKTERYIMWYEDRHPGQAGYAIAASKTPTDPFNDPQLCKDAWQR